MMKKKKKTCVNKTFFFFISATNFQCITSLSQSPYTVKSYHHTPHTM